MNEQEPQDWSDTKLVAEVRKLLDSYGDEYNDPLIEAVARLIERSTTANADVRILSKKEQTYIAETLINIKINMAQGAYLNACNGVDAVERRLKENRII